MWKKIKFKYKLGLLILIPLFVELIFGYQTIQNNNSEYQNSLATLELAQLSQVTSNIIHELQKERGMSAGYIGSKGQNFKTKLPNQWEDTDEKTAMLSTS